MQSNSPNDADPPSGIHDPNLAASDKTKRPLLAAISSWDRNEFAEWLERGLDIWFHPDATDGDRAIAFEIGILQPDQYPIPQIIALVARVKGATALLRQAGSELLGTWTASTPHAGLILQALLELAQELPSPGCLPALRRLFFDGYIADVRDRGFLGLKIVEVILALGGLPGGKRLLTDLPRSPEWRPSFAATWIEGMISLGDRPWLNIVYARLAELQAYNREPSAWRPFFLRLIQTIGDVRTVALELRKRKRLDIWLQDVLFVGHSPPIKINDTSGRRMHLVIGERDEIIGDERPFDIFFKIKAEIDNRLADREQVIDLIDKSIEIFLPDAA